MENIDPKKCKCGNPTINVDIQFCWYGPSGAKLVCKKCGKETKRYSVYDYQNNGTTIATPCTDSSMMRGIHKALEEWNENN